MAHMSFSCFFFPSFLSKFVVRCNSWMVKRPKDLKTFNVAKTSRHIGFHAEASLHWGSFTQEEWMWRHNEMDRLVQRRCVGSFPNSLEEWWNDLKCTLSTYHVYSLLGCTPSHPPLSTSQHENHDFFCGGYYWVFSWHPNINLFLSCFITSIGWSPSQQSRQKLKVKGAHAMIRLAQNPCKSHQKKRYR